MKDAKQIIRELVEEVLEEVSQEEQKYVDAVLKNTNANMTEQEFDKQVMKNLTDWYDGDRKAVRSTAIENDDFWGWVYGIFNEKYGHLPQKVAGYSGGP